MNPNRFQIRILDDFDQINPSDWNKLLKVSRSNSVFITWQWQKVWWEVFGRGKLILVVAEKADSLTAIAPLFSDGGMIFLWEAVGRTTSILLAIFPIPYYCPECFRQRRLQSPTF